MQKDAKITRNRTLFLFLQTDKLRNFIRHTVGEGLAPPEKSAQSNIFSPNNKIPIDFFENICYTKIVNTKINSILFERIEKIWNLKNSQTK